MEMEISIIEKKEGHESIDFNLSFDRTIPISSSEIVDLTFK